MTFNFAGRMNAALFFFFFLTFCVPIKAQEHIELARWLCGTWKNAVFNQSETWKHEGNTLIGNGLALETKDTLFYERLEINLTANPMVYTSWVKGQNDGNGIEFELTASTEFSWVFENPQHDFPKKIKYIRTGTSTLEVFISGLENGMLREEHLYFIRIID